MASLVPRCRPLLRGPCQPLKRQTSRQRAQASCPFSSTSKLHKGDDRKKPSQGKRPAQNKTEPGAVFDTGFSKLKGRTRWLPEGWQDHELASSYSVEKGSSALTSSLKRTLARLPKTQAAEANEALYDEDGLDENGLPRLARGDEWIDRKVGLSKSMVKEMQKQPPLHDDTDNSSFYGIDEEKDDPGDDPEFESDDITSLAHAELEQHRELREFYRVMAWDMPLLYNHRKSYQPPTAAQPLRFRYTTYMGEAHPAARKVVMDFTPSALPGLSSKEATKLIKLLGPRYNPGTDRAKISCEMFPTAAQNKRWLGDILEKLISETKNGKDTLEDLPFDFRHYKPKKQFEFPEEWNMTEERRNYLDAKRKELPQAQIRALIDETESIKQIDGVQQPEMITIPAQEAPTAQSKLRQ